MEDLDTKRKASPIQLDVDEGRSKNLTNKLEDIRRKRLMDRDLKSERRSDAMLRLGINSPTVQKRMVVTRSSTLKKNPKITIANAFDSSEDEKELVRPKKKQGKKKRKKPKTPKGRKKGTLSSTDIAKLFVDLDDSDDHDDDHVKPQKATKRRKSDPTNGESPQRVGIRSVTGRQSFPRRSIKSDFDPFASDVEEENNDPRNNVPPHVASLLSASDAANQRKVAAMKDLLKNKDAEIAKLRIDLRMNQITIDEMTAELRDLQREKKKSKPQMLFAFLAVLGVASCFYLAPFESEFLPL